MNVIKQWNLVTIKHIDMDECYKDNDPWRKGSCETYAIECHFQNFQKQIIVNIILFKITCKLCKTKKKWK